MMRATPGKEHIKVSVSRSYMTDGRYYVTVKYDCDPYALPASGSAQAQEGMLYKWFGVGDSLETSLKKATCEAISNLKEEWERREHTIDLRLQLQDVCINHMADCGEEK
jgi:hypothetical protein